MAQSKDIVIVSATRTPVGSFSGSFANTPAYELGAIVVKSALEQAQVDGADVDEVILGHVLAAGQGQNTARQAAIGAGIPKEATAWAVNQVCGSGLRSVALGMQQITSGDADIIVAGGQENMTLSPHCQHLRAGHKMGDYAMIDTMIKDGLWDAFNGYHMGTTAENVAEQWQITRDDPGRASPSRRRTRPRRRRRPAGSSRRDHAGHRSRPARVGDIVVEDDEYIRHGVTARKPWPSCVRPSHKEGTVTAGNASGINDGAAAVVLMTAEEAEQARPCPAGPHRVLGQPAGVDPAIMGTGPIPAVAQGAGAGRLEDADDLDLVEANEAFAAQACAVNKDHGLGHGQGQRQWRRDRHRPPGRRLGRARAGDPAARDEAARRQEGPGHAVHRRRHGHRHVRRARLTRNARTVRQRT